MFFLEADSSDFLFMLAENSLSLSTVAQLKKSAEAARIKKVGKIAVFIKTPLQW